MLAKDGATRWLQWSAAGLPDEEQFLAVACDVTPGHEAQTLVRESERRYQDSIESAHDIVQSILPDGHFQFVNRAWHEALGYTPEELPGLTLFDIVDESDHDHCTLLIAQLMSGKSFDQVEVTFVAKDGRTFPVEGNATGRFGDGGYLGTHTFSATSATASMPRRWPPPTSGSWRTRWPSVPQPWCKVKSWPPWAA